MWRKSRVGCGQKNQQAIESNFPINVSINIAIDVRVEESSWFLVEQTEHDKTLECNV